MATKRGAFFLLLFVACAALAKSPWMPENRRDFKDVVRRLMKRCKEKGYPVPNMTVLRKVFSDSDLPKDTDSGGQSTPPAFISILNSVNHVKDSIGQKPSDDDTISMDYSKLLAMIQKMRNYSEASVCYMHAYIAPQSWILTTQSESDTDLDDYGNLLWGAIPMLDDMPFNRMKLQRKASRQKVEKMMKVLREEYKFMSEEKMVQVVKWVKQQIIQNDFNCTMKPSSHSTLHPIQRCKPSLKWLNFEKLTMIGPYLSHLTPKDVDSGLKEQLCKYFDSGKLRMVIKLNPSLARRLQQRFQECYNGEEFTKNVDKLGILACHNPTIPDLTPDLSRKLLSQLNDCDENDNPRIKQLKKRLVMSAMSDSNSVQALLKQGNSVKYLPRKLLSMITWSDLKDIGKNPMVQFTRSQMRVIIKKQLGNITCEKVLGKELIDLQSVAGGLPSCVLKHVKAPEILSDTKALENMSKGMRKGQLKALVQALRENVDPSELVTKLQGPLPQSLSLTDMVKAKNTSLDQVVGKLWRPSQAVYLAKKFHEMRQLRFWGLGSVLQGITCKMIDEVLDSDVQDMARDITETPQWLSKQLVACVAQRLVRVLEQNRPDYFKTITERELDAIPTILLIHFPPSKLSDLPKSVCSVFLDKMEVADLRSLPLRSPSHPTLTERALRCLELREDMSRLGRLLCGLNASKLQFMPPEVLKSSLQAMALCQHIPQQHRADLIQLVTQTFGDTSEWSAETMEQLGALILLDDNATAALLNKPWMKDVLRFLMSRLSQPSDAIRRKVFALTTTASNAARKKREANSNGIDSDNGNGNSDSKTGTDSAINPKESMEVDIEGLGKENIYWTPDELDQIKLETFTDAVETLGAISDYSADQLAVLIKKAVEAFGPVSKMNDSVVIQMGCIAQGFSNDDLKTLPLSMDTLEEIAHCRWSELQVKTIWRTAAKYNNVMLLGAVEIASLSQFICGLDSTDFTKITIDAFKEAVDTLANINCSIEVIQQFKNLALSAFGEPRHWTEAQVSDLGGIIAALDAKEFSTLDPPLFMFFKKSSIPLIPLSTFASLSPTQLEALGPTNAEMVTAEQQAVLRDDQRAALERAMTGSNVPNKTTAQSGAPSLSIEGISAFMKSLLFLLLGSLLL